MTIACMLVTHLTGNSMLVNALHQLPATVAKSLESDEQIKSLAQNYRDSTWFCFAGWGPNSATAYEVALKINEAAYSVTTGFQLEQFLHGPFVAMTTGCFLSLIIPGAAVFSVIRILRVLRVFRVLKLVQFMGEAELLRQAMIASKRKIFVYLFFLLNLVIVLGSLMYLIEGEESGFDSIPRSIYWAIVTLTTVGYGDISPVTNLGQFIAAIIMIMGYSIIAVPTGIVTSSMNFTKDKYRKTCIVCNDDRQTSLAKFCNQCGAKMPEDK